MPHVLFHTPGLRYVRSHPTTNEPEGIRRRAGAGGAYFFDGKKNNNKEIKYFTIGVFQPNVSVSTTTTTVTILHFASTEVRTKIKYRVVRNSKLSTRFRVPYITGILRIRP